MPGRNSAGARGVPFRGRGFELLLSGDVRIAWGLLLLSWGIVLVSRRRDRPRTLAARRSVD
jgi:hypothetical protein